MAIESRLEKSFHTLFKRSSQGKIEQWTISVNEKINGTGEIVTIYGEYGGKMQETSDVIREGKNKGRKNETTAIQQAVAEAQSKWDKKVKAGYVQSFLQAEVGAVDETVIGGGIVPMLAHSFSKSGEKISYPCAGQPKLDGIRCIAIKKGDEVTLWTRTRKSITSCPHIIEAIKQCFFGDITLDGELYNHDYKDQFEKIVSAVRKEEPTEEAKMVQYHIYDTVIPDTAFRDRLVVLHMAHEGPSDYLSIVETSTVESESDVTALFDNCRKDGYEGAMLRNMESLYENKRSYSLQKVKEFDDAEFEIIGVEEGRGKLAGLVGAFVCKTREGTEFRAKPAGDQEATKTYLENPKSVIGRLLTVKYQGMTNGDSGSNAPKGVPRFPVGLRIREIGL